MLLHDCVSIWCYNIELISNIEYDASSTTKSNYIWLNWNDNMQSTHSCANHISTAWIGYCLKHIGMDLMINYQSNPFLNRKVEINGPIGVYNAIYVQMCILCAIVKQMDALLSAANMDCYALITIEICLTINNPNYPFSTQFLL